MALKIIQYPHPTLRHVAKPVKRVDAELKQWIAEMFGLMYQAKGIGLAATQVDLPYRLFVVNVTADPAQPEHEQVFINPVLSLPKGVAAAEEGCLSLPGLYAEVSRPERIVLNAYTLDGKEVHEELDGLMARVVQHETDHLNGVLFIDRLSDVLKSEHLPILDEFHSVFDSRRSIGEIPPDSDLRRRLADLESARC